MDLKRIKYFCAVFEHGSISQASKSLHIAQPPLSLRIKELEEELGVLLFDRNGSGIKPTEAGHFLYNKCCILLKDIENIRKDISRFSKTHHKTIRIGLSHLFQSYFKKFFLEMHNRHEDIEIIMSVSDSSHLEYLLESGLIDIALIQKPTHVEGFECLEMYPLNMLAVINEKLAAGLEQDGMIAFEDIARYPLALLKKASGIGVYEKVIDHLHGLGKNPDVLMNISQPRVIIDMLESGLAAATILPASELQGVRLEHCVAVHLHSAPPIFCPALIKMQATPRFDEVMEILEEGYMKCTCPQSEGVSAV